LYCGQQGISDDEIGLRKTSLLDDNGITEIAGEKENDAPGTSKRITRSYENSPPLIPHDISFLGPITLSENGCFNCHDPKVAEGVGATPVPRTHLMELSDGKDLKGSLNGKNYNCTQCHVPQRKITPPVDNKFNAEYRSDKSRNRSNLADVLNEGVKVGK
ncbi:MAG: nitrate reductase cytochrome c-type subunit, partial [Nitrospirae bacterium]|nr:nitrate reductase cytochrome c-type subunit [Nitrospirota bacterium]